MLLNMLSNLVITFLQRRSVLFSLSVMSDSLQPDRLASGPITSWEIDGETVETVSDFIFLAPKSLQMVTAAMKFKDAYSLEEK